MMMRRQVLWAAMVGIAVGAGAQTSAPAVKDDLFAGTEKFAQGATSVTQIDMDPESLGKVDGKDGLKARRTVLSVVHTYEYDKPGMYRIEDVEAFRKKLETSLWHCTVHIREMKTGESTDVCNKQRDDGMREEAVITVEPKSLTFIHTIRKAGATGGMSGLSLPLEMRTIGPEMKAEMAVARAEMQAQMAMMRPEMQRQMETLKNFKAPAEEEMKRLRDELKAMPLYNQGEGK